MPVQLRSILLMFVCAACSDDGARSGDDSQRERGSPADEEARAGTGGRAGGEDGTQPRAAGEDGSAAAGGGGRGASSGSGGRGAADASAPEPVPADDDGDPADAGVPPASDAGLDDPAPGEYGTRAQLLAANSEMAVAAVSGKIYVLGGYPSSREVQSTVQVYDPATDSWTLGTALPEAIHHPVVVGVADKLYSFGGQRDAGDSARTLVLDPANPGSWNELAPMPTARGAGAAAVIGDKVYVVGGRPPAGNAFEVYDISDDAWTELPDLPQSLPDRNHLAAAAIGGKVYVAGGRYAGGSFSDPITDSLDVFDPVTGAWTTGANMLRPRGGVNGVAAFGCFHVWGGEGANTGEPNNVFPDHDVYDPRTNTWTELADLPTPVHGVTGAAFVDGLIYIPGGGTSQGGSSGSRLFQVYRPAMRCD